ncbi:MAG: leucine-rich repeat domain-containing protein, partial [Bacteroidales bacterium]|nr:leucine-rich repeat domain-containing protein [Bacteroidales bacterium]
TGSLTIGNTVTTIGSGAFSWCSGLTGSLTIGNSVTEIGSYAFSGCSGLTGGLTIGNSVTEIGSYAFSSCSGLTGSLTIPNSVTTISDNAFYGCNGFTGSLTIPNSVTMIGVGAFSNCSGFTGSLTIPNSVTTIGDWAFGVCSGFTGNLTIGNSVTTIGIQAFSSCSGFTGSLIIGNSVTEIGDMAFFGCIGLTGSLTIPNSVTDLGSLAFSWCSGFTGSLTIGNSVATIGNEAFSGCSGLSSIISFPSTPPSLGDNVFYNTASDLTFFVPCGTLESYQLANGWSTLNLREMCAGEITATANPTEGGTVTGAGYYEGGTTCTMTATPVEGYLFLNWSKDGQIVSTDSIYSFIVAGDADFVANFAEEGEVCALTFDLFDSYGDGYTGNYLVVNFPDGSSQQLTVESGYSASHTLWIAHSSHITLTWIVGSYPEDCSFTVSYSNGYVIYHCENLNESFSYEFDVDCVFSPMDNIIFADTNVKAICVANWDTNGDGELSYAEAAAVTDLGQVFRGNTEITSFEELRDFVGLNSIGDYEFFNCHGLTSIEIPNSVISIGIGAFRNCSSMARMVVESGNTVYDSRGNCNSIIKTSTNELVAGCKNTIIPNSVTSIGNNAFTSCIGLTSITIPNSVTSIGYSAFSYCTYLTSITIPDPVSFIGNNAFYHCTSLTSISICNSVTYIGHDAFSDCSSLEQMLVASGNTVYDSRGNCNAIIKTSTNELVAGCKTTVIPDSVTSIGNDAFYFCSGLTSIEIPNSVISIGSLAFEGCTGLTSIEIPNSVTSIERGAFWGCSNLTDIVMLGTIPPSFGSDVYIYTNNCPIYVPYESVNDYKTTTNWSDYEDRIFPMAYTTISGYGEGEGNYRFIASPLVENTAPTAVDNMITETAYDLYRFDQSEDDEWQNYKYPENTPNFFLTNGQGYLYANAEDVNLIFKGAFNEDDTKEVGLAYDANAEFAGWNLVGNPFPVSAYASRSCYTMNEDGTGIEPNMVSSATAIPACTGVMVMAEAEGETVVFSTEAPEATTNQGCLQIAVAQTTTRGNAIQDKAIVSFNAGDRLEKFVFNKENAVISIPQGGKELAIACTDKQGEMPLNFKATKNGEYTLTIHSEAVDLDYLHLIDNLTGADVDLLQTPAYSFTAKTTDYTSRFRLVFFANDASSDPASDAPFAFISNGSIVIIGAEA